jgi:hypothetical protein
MPTVGLATTAEPTLTPFLESRTPSATPTPAAPTRTATDTPATTPTQAGCQAVVGAPFSFEFLDGGSRCVAVQAESDCCWRTDVVFNDGIGVTAPDEQCGNGRLCFNASCDCVGCRNRAELIVAGKPSSVSCRNITVTSTPTQERTATPTPTPTQAGCRNVTLGRSEVMLFDSGSACINVDATAECCWQSAVLAGEITSLDSPSEQCGSALICLHTMCDG